MPKPLPKKKPDETQPAQPATVSMPATPTDPLLAELRTMSALLEECLFALRSCAPAIYTPELLANRLGIHKSAATRLCGPAGFMTADDLIEYEAKKRSALRG